MSALFDGSDRPLSYATDKLLDKCRSAEVVLGLSHKGEVEILKSRYFPERVGNILSTQDTIDYLSHFVAHQCATKNGHSIQMFKEGIALEVDRVVNKYIEDNK